MCTKPVPDRTLLLCYSLVCSALSGESVASCLPRRLTWKHCRFVPDVKTTLLRLVLKPGCVSLMAATLKPAPTLPIHLCAG